MSFTAKINRVRADFVEMPGLELSLPQAVRLWNLDVDECQVVLDALTDSGFLKWTHRRTVIRTGQEPSYEFDRDLSYVLVRQTFGRDKSV